MQNCFLIETLAPPGDLSDVVTEFWQLTPRGNAPYLPTQMFPSLSSRIRFVIQESAAETLVYGPSLSANRKGLYFTSHVSFGATLKPLGLSSIFGSEASCLFSRRVKAKSILGSGLSELEEQITSTPSFRTRAQLLSGFLRSRRCKPQNDTLLEMALSEFINGPCTVADVSARLGVSRRTLLRKFNPLGISPKGAARVTRLQRSLSSCVAGQAHNSHPCDLFADQSHFIREFREMIGLTPGQFIDMLPNLDHLGHQSWQHLNPGDYASGVPGFHFI